MTSKRWTRWLTTGIVCAMLSNGLAIRAQQPDATKQPPKAGVAVNRELEREYALLAKRLTSDNAAESRDAAEKLLLVQPSDVANKDTRILIARGFHGLANDSSRLNQEVTIRGLVIWGGKFSVPVLIELMDKEQLKVSGELFTALGQLKDPRGAEAVARHLGNFFNHEGAVKSLRAMGSAAEDVLIKSAPSNDPAVAIAAVQLLGEVGGEKSLPILQRASTAKNPDVKFAARESLKRIRLRQKNGEPVDQPPKEDPDSPFAGSKGPPVDIRPPADLAAGRKSRNIGNANRPEAKSSILISKETTFVTEPLRADGFPDYEQYALALSGGRVQSADNAAVLICQAMWPGEIAAADYEAVCKELGLANVPSEKGALKLPDSKANEQRMLSWLREGGNANSTDETLKVLLDRAKSRPWKSNAVPPLAAWVEENATTIDLIVAATKRPQYYFPSPSFLNKAAEPVIESLVPGAQMSRGAARALGLRAMRHLGDGRIDKAWDDIRAMHRLARLQYQGPMLVEKLIAIQINDDACRATVTLLSSSKVSPEQAERVNEEMLELPEFQGMAGTLDKMERVSYLDSVLSLKAGKAEGWKELLELSDTIVRMFSLPADWNIVLRRGNELFDLIALAAVAPMGAARDKAIDEVNAVIRRAEDDARDRVISVAALSPPERGEVYSSLTIALMCPDVAIAIALQDNANTMRELTRTAVGLARYQAQHGSYPETLDAAVPGAIDELPLDLFTSKPFIYKRLDSGYLLYSPGANRRDEGGSNERAKFFQGRSSDELEAGAGVQAKIPVGADDISILVP